MMKKLVFSMMSLGLVFATSCSNDESVPAPSTEKTSPDAVTFTCEVPQSMRSRGVDANGMFGDGLDANKLQYVVYGDGHIYMSSQDANAPKATYTGNGKFSLTVQLREFATSDNSYDVFFWADAWGEDGGSPYTLDYAAHTVTVDYEKSLSMYDKADAFAYWGHFTNPGKGKSLNFKLTRPFAQVNIVTNEFNTFNEDNNESHVKVGFAQKQSGSFELANVWNYKDGTYSASQFGTLTDLGSVIAKYPLALDTRVVIKNMTMRYIYLGYIFPQPGSLPATVTTMWESNPNSLIGHDVTAFELKRNCRYFLYPQGAKPDDDPEYPGDGFLTSSVGVEIEIMPSFDEQNEYPAGK